MTASHRAQERRGRSLDRPRSRAGPKAAAAPRQRLWEDGQGVVSNLGNPRFSAPASEPVNRTEGLFSPRGQAGCEPKRWRAGRVAVCGLSTRGVGSVQGTAKVAWSPQVPAENAGPAGSTSHRVSL